MQIPAPHQAEDGTTSERCTFHVGALPARHGDVLGKAAPNRVLFWNCKQPRNEENTQFTLRY